jgi:thiol-disulfide isomerase/thioredoxin/outer membrane lipoprotein-sorting protein
MHLSLRLVCGLALVVAGLSGSARLTQAVPRQGEVKSDVAALLQQSTDAYKQMKSYQHIAVWQISAKTPQGERSQEVKYTLGLERPNKFVYKSDTPTQDVAVCDGTNFINYRLQTHEYTKSPAPATYAGINIVDDVMFQPQATYLIAMMLQGNALADKDFNTALISHLKVGSSDTVDGQKTDTLVADINGATITFYIDAATHRMVKSVQKVPAQSVTVTETITDVKVDKPVDAALFQYTPPANAKLVAKLTNPQEALAAAMKAQEAETKALVEKYEGKPAPDFNLKTRDGKFVSLTALRGKIVVVDFWASWCGPCKMVMPTIQEIHEKYGNKGVVVLAVDTWDAKADCAAFLKENPKYTMTVLMDPAERKSVDSVATKLYGVHGIPTTVIIGKDGMVKTYAIGAHERSYYMDALKRLGVQVAAK